MRYTAVMFVASLIVAVAVLAQEGVSTVDVTLMKAKLGGSCTAEVVVKDAAGKPVSGAAVHVNVRYGFAGVKKADLTVETSPAGKVRIEGLPDKAKPMTYDVTKDDLKAAVTQDVASMCHAAFDVTLK